MNEYYFNINLVVKSGETKDVIIEKLTKLFESLNQTYANTEYGELFSQFENSLVATKIEIDTARKEIEEIKQLLLSPIDDFKMSARLKRVLSDEGIIYYHQLVSKDETEFLHQRNFGRKSLSELGDLVDNLGYGIRFGMDVKKYIE